jgi:hypothetical protein
VTASLRISTQFATAPAARRAPGLVPEDVTARGLVETVDDSGEPVRSRVVAVASLTVHMHPGGLTGEFAEGGNGTGARLRSPRLRLFSRLAMPMAKGERTTNVAIAVE